MLTMMATAPKVALGNPERNLAECLKAVNAAIAANADILVLPSLCLTGATCGALLRAPILLRAAWEALLALSGETPDGLFVLASLPVELGHGVFECAAVIENGAVAALVPRVDKARPFVFHPGLDTGETPDAFNGIPVLREGCYRSERLGGLRVVFSLDDIRGEGVFLCPSGDHATIRSQTRARHALRKARSLGAAVAYASPGGGESVTDYVFDGYCALLCGGETTETSLLLSREPLSAPTQAAQAPPPAAVSPGARFPFLSADAQTAQKELLRLLPLQALALKRRALHIRSDGFIVGLSGGLDSTLALLACVSAADRMRMPAKSILAVTMPGFGTGERTKTNADSLAKELGVSYEEIPIVDVVRRHFMDIGQSESDFSITFENAQARMRTLTLLDLANQRNLLFVGSGDLSELALGWTTFGGDHLSSYAINGSVPKTLVRGAVELCAKSLRFKGAGKALRSICATPVSPELVPGGAAAQQTEDILGSYELHDFFLYHMLTENLEPRELLQKAVSAFKTAYEPQNVENALRTMLSRFYKNQFKRNCMPEGPQLTDVSLSSRALALPSDLDDTLFQL